MFRGNRTIGLQIIMTVVILGAMVALSVPVVKARHSCLGFDCENTNSGPITQVSVEAYIAGVSPSSSSGYGEARGSIISSKPCFIDNAMIVHFNTSLGYFVSKAGPVNSIISHNYPPGEAGSWVLSEVAANLCDNTRVAVMAVLNGGCVS